MTEEIREHENGEIRTNDKLRMLNFTASNSTFEPVDGGGTIMKNVLALDEGTWSDSVVGTPLFYPARVLEEYVGNWKATGFWPRHSGGAPRKVTERAGRVINQRFMNTGMYVDVFFHEKTQESRELLEMYKAGEASAVSIEHGGEEVYNKSLSRWEAKSLNYYGLASVDQGACTTCGVKKDMKCHSKSTEITNELSVDEEVSEMKDEDVIKMFSEMKADFEAQLKGINEKFASFDASKSVAELSVKVEGLVKELSEKDGRIKALESKPVSQGVVVGEVHDAPMRVRVDNADVLPRK